MSFSEQELQRAYAVSHKLFIDLVEKGGRKDIQSVGPGAKIRTRKWLCFKWEQKTSELAIVIGVVEKKPLALLAAELVIPKTVEDYPTDVQTVGIITKLDLKDRVRPARPGYSWGNFRITAGTPGVKVRYQGQEYVDTNWHVSFYKDGQVGDAILQPGTYDGGQNPADKVGEAAIALENPWSGKGCYTDYGLVKMTVTFTNVLPILEVPPGPWKEDYKPGDSLMWVGRTSGKGEASISQMHQDCQVQLETGKTAYFYDTDIFRPACLAGDSGSWVGFDESWSGQGTKQYPTIGKVFAGSDYLGIMIPARSIRKIYQGIEIVTETDNGNGNGEDEDYPVAEIENISFFVRVTGGAWTESALLNIGDENNTVPRYRWHFTPSAEGPHEIYGRSYLKNGKIKDGSIVKFLVKKKEEPPPPPPPPAEDEPEPVVETPLEGEEVELGKDKIITIYVRKKKA